MKHNGKGRVIALLVLCAVVFALFLARLAWMQFGMAGYYQQKLAQASQSSYTVALPAARGAITDQNGTVLARDKTEYGLSLCVPAPPGTQMAETLQTLEQLDLGGKDVETRLAAFCSAVSAGELPLADALTDAQRAAVLEAGLVQSGAVRLTAHGTRTAADGTLAPQLLGGVGAMSAAQQEANPDLPADSEIGQWGLEAAWDEVLRGTPGQAEVSVLRGSGARTVRQAQAPQAGHTLELWLDADLQQTLREALQAQITALQSTKAAGQGREACAGAAVVVDVQTGGVLAAVSLPDYDLNTWRQDYAALTEQADAPLLNRVLNGLYAPGSAFKPAVAAAALAAGLVAPETTVFCGGVYTHYAGYRPRCLGLGHSGAVDLVTALRYSCNVYFYDAGRRLGADAMAVTARLLGLGADTGAELGGAAGRLTLSADENYQDGLTLMAAIGQGNTAVTPLQLAAYACALARDGARPALRFARRILTAQGETVWQSEPEILAAAPGGQEVFGPIREGMKQMAQTLRVLREAPLALACKTGSPQLAGTLGDGSHYTNSVLIGYGPADAPRFAAAVVIEYGGGGANAATVLRAAADWFAAHGVR